MPITWDEATYAVAYQTRCGIPEHTVATVGHDIGTPFSYGREMMEHGRWSKYTRWRDDLIANFGIDPADRVLCGGCGFGYLISAFHEAGYPYVGGIDVSPYIAANGVQTFGDVVMVEEDLRNGGQIGAALRALQRDLGVPGPRRSAQWEWLITESMLESYTDAELPGLLDDCQWAIEPPGTYAHIVHLVHTDPMPLLPAANEKSLAEWAAMRPTHSWQEVTGARGFVIGSDGL